MEKNIKKILTKKLGDPNLVNKIVDEIGPLFDIYSMKTILMILISVTIKMIKDVNKTIQTDDDDDDDQIKTHFNLEMENGRLRPIFTRNKKRMTGYKDHHTDINFNNGNTIIYGDGMAKEINIENICTIMKEMIEIRNMLRINDVLDEYIKYKLTIIYEFMNTRPCYENYQKIIFDSIDVYKFKNIEIIREYFGKINILFGENYEIKNCRLCQANNGHSHIMQPEYYIDKKFAVKFWDTYKLIIPSKYRGKYADKFRTLKFNDRKKLLI